MVFRDVERWFADRGDYPLRLDYDLTKILLFGFLVDIMEIMFKISLISINVMYMFLNHVFHLIIY